MTGESVSATREISSRAFFLLLFLFLSFFLSFFFPLKLWIRFAYERMAFTTSCSRFLRFLVRSLKRSRPGSTRTTEPVSCKFYYCDRCRIWPTPPPFGKGEALFARSRKPLIVIEVPREQAFDRRCSNTLSAGWKGEFDFLKEITIDRGEVLREVFEIGEILIR